MAKASKLPAPPIEVRTRRAYFDCRFGQLHVRTAFPTTGGFDEGVTLFCLHPLDASSRAFVHLMPQLADVRSVYAPDLPGHGESDPAPAHAVSDAASAVSDLANGLRLRQIDVLGVQYGADVALELGLARPELVRRVVLSTVPSPERLALLKQPKLLIEAGSETSIETASAALAKRIGDFLSGAG